MKNLPLWFLLLLAGTALLGCPSKDNQSETARQRLPPMKVVHVGAITPVNLPTTLLDGHPFPDTTDITGWVQNQDTAQIYLHGWSLWAAITAFTNQEYKGDTLRVFQTWQTKAGIAAAAGSPYAKARALAAQGPMNPRRLTPPTQFKRDPRLRRRLHALMAAHAMGNDVNSLVHQVCYNPSAATSIISGKLFSDSTLNHRVSIHQGDIPDFGTDAVAIKPMYKIIPGPNSPVPSPAIRVWTGVPAACQSNPLGCNQSMWTDSVYVDITNRSLSKRTGRGAGATYNLNDFIHFTLDSAEAVVMNARPGDYAVLVGMHITTNEFGPWTWQTLWWTPTPDVMYAPSTAGVLAARPAELTGAPAHYTMSIGYQMLVPAQPTFSATSTPPGTPIGKSLYVYNPYLEAPFSSSTFPADSLLYYNQVITNGLFVTNNYGITTNCMSCHQMASYQGQAQNVYLGDTYVDTSKTRYRRLFAGGVRTDFLWSVANQGAPD